VPDSLGSGVSKVFTVLQAKDLDLAIADVQKDATGITRNLRTEAGLSPPKPSPSGDFFFGASFTDKTRYAHLVSKVNLTQAIDFKALRNAYLVTQQLGIPAQSAVERIWHM